MGDGTGTHDKVTSLDSPGKTEQGAVNTRIKIDCQQDNQVSVSLSVYEFVQEEAPNSQHPDRFNHDVDSDFVSDFVQNLKSLSDNDSIDSIFFRNFCKTDMM